LGGENERGAEKQDGEDGRRTAHDISFSIRKEEPFPAPP
jgi:hypothetical protein